MIIERVNNKENAIKCDELLTKLINSESKYDTNLKSNYQVKNYFENKYEDKDNCLFVAKDDKNLIIGYSYCKITTDDNGPYIHHIALLDGLYVDEKYRKQGIATQLIKACKDWALQIGAKIFELNVNSENINAIELYKKIGFNEFEKKMRLEL